MIKCKVTKEYLLINNNEKIYYDTFKLLTGKSFDINIRINKNIILNRDRGNLRIYDEFYIKGCDYKNNNYYYNCRLVDEKGNALLNKQGINLTLISNANPFKDGLEIV